MACESLQFEMDESLVEPLLSEWLLRRVDPCSRALYEECRAACVSFEQSLLEVLRNAAIVESLEWVAKEKMVTVIGVNDEPELDRES